MAEVVDMNRGLSRISGRDRRTQSIATRFTPAEEQVLLRRAASSGQNLREWAREVLLREANAPTASGEIELLLTEIVGLQLFLAHVLAPVACGDTISAAEYEKLLQQVRATKRRAARDVMTERATPGEKAHE